jgi:hypothetical protein
LGTPYSFSPQDLSGSLTYQVIGSGCAGWNIQISADDFVYDGSHGGTAIPNGNVSITPGPVSEVTGSTANITVGTPGTLSSSLKVLSAAVNAGTGTYNQTLDVGVAIPGAARVGTYTWNITITAAAGP